MRNFRNPPKEFRPAPFWAWNDELDPKELVWQVGEMARAGFGGYFMHARVGLATAFMGREWMEAIGACVRAGKRAGMQSWLYDEDKWPSGSAGGLVTRGHTERAAKRLEEDTKWAAGRQYVASFEWDETRRRYRRLAAGESARGTFLGYRVASGANLDERNPGQGMNNGQPYSDLLDGKIVEAFLRISYDPYARRFGKSFGEFVPGIFMDEPHVWRYGSLPWTGRLPAVFLGWNGYDLLDRLPDLYRDAPGAARTRHDFWRTVGRLYREAFSRKVYERCERLGLQLTGHYLSETPLAGQARCSGAVMPHYRHEHMPGIDHLGRHNGVTMHLRQVASAAAQTGRRRVLCEIFGCSGHSMTFEDQKWLCDLHFACGVNFLNPHLTLYTMKGDAKRDYPPTLSYHQPWWRHYRGMNDYIARCSAAVSTGVPCAEILVLHPMSSVWCHLRARDEAPGARKIDRALSAVIRHLEAIQREFHFGDETLLAELGRVRGEVLRVGRMSYRAVIVPPSLTWSSTTLQFLERFRGPILFVGEIPRLVDARSSEAWGKMLSRGNVRRIRMRRRDIEQALDAVPPSRDDAGW
ncbi:MAG: glycosyl hydrolase [Planctomycetota bacterium]